MAIERLRLFLQRHNRIALDTSIFIHQIEAHPKYVNLTQHLFSWLQEPGAMGFASTVTMTEVLVQAYRDSDEQRVCKFYGLLASYPNLHWISPDLEIAAAAAKIRALHRLRTPEALQAATAQHSLATALVTNDPIFARITTFETLTLGSLV